MKLMSMRMMKPERVLERWRGSAVAAVYGLSQGGGEGGSAAAGEATMAGKQRLKKWINDSDFGFGLADRGA